MNLKPNTNKILTAFISLLFLVVTGILLILLNKLNDSEYFTYMVALSVTFMILLLLMIVYWTQLDNRMEFVKRGILENEAFPPGEKEPSLTEGQSAVKSAGINLEFSQEQKAESAIPESEAKNRMLADELPDAIREKNLADSIINTLPGIFYLYTQQDKFIRWNKNFEIVSGYSADEISTMHALDFFNDQYKALLTSKIQNVFIKGEDSVEADFLIKSGKNIPYYFTGKAVEYQGNICLMGVGMDCTERNKAEERIRLSEKKYRLLFDDNPVPLWIYSLKDLHFMDVNEAAIKHYGYTKEEFKNMNIKDIRPQEDIHYLTTEKQSYRGISNAGVWRHIKKDGSLIRVEIITHDTYYEGEHVRLVLANDITKKYIAEEKLRESLEAVRQLSSHQHLIREEERKRIGHEIHDELGQQLTAIKMDISWIDKKISDENPVVKSKLKNVIELLDASNTSVRRILSELRPAVLDDIGLLEAIEWLGNQFTIKTTIPVQFSSSELNITIPEEFAVCIYRVCQEAFTNITRYANAKRVSVCISTSNEEITVIIEDDGKGFDLKTLPKDTRSFGILGMRERVLALGGQFELISSPNIGTKIRMALPMTL